MESNESIIESIQSGKGNCNELLETLWKKNLPLIRKFIHEITGLDHWKESDRQDYEDMEQQAFLALMEAAYSYKPEKGAKFMTHAYSVISGRMCRYYARFCQTVRVPEYVRGNIKRYKKAYSELAASGKAVTRKELCEQTGMTMGKIMATEETIQRLRILSLDQRLDGEDPDSGTVLDMIADTGDMAENVIESQYLKDLHNVLMCAIRELPRQEREIIIAYHFMKTRIGHIARIRECTSQNIYSHLQTAYLRIRTGKYGKELRTFLPKKAAARAERKTAKDLELLKESLSDHEMDLLL